MSYNLYFMFRNLYEIQSQCKLANNIVKVSYGYISPQHMIYDAYKDEIIKHILFK